MRHKRGRNKSYWEWDCVKKQLPHSAVGGYKFGHINLLLTPTCWSNSPMKSLQVFLGVPGWCLFSASSLFLLYSFWSCFLLMFQVYKAIEGFAPHRHGERYPPWGPLLYCPVCLIYRTWSARHHCALFGPHPMGQMLCFVFFSNLCVAFPQLRWKHYSLCIIHTMSPMIFFSLYFIYILSISLIDTGCNTHWFLDVRASHFPLLSLVYNPPIPW